MNEVAVYANVFSFWMKNHAREIVEELSQNNSVGWLIKIPNSNQSCLTTKLLLRPIHDILLQWRIKQHNCFLAAKETNTVPKKITYPIVDFWSTLSPDQFESLFVVRIRWLGWIGLLLEDVALKYLKTLFKRWKWRFNDWSMCWQRRLTTKARFDRVMVRYHNTPTN